MRNGPVATRQSEDFHHLATVAALQFRLDTTSFIRFISCDALASGSLSFIAFEFSGKMHLGALAFLFYPQDE